MSSNAQWVASAPAPYGQSCSQCAKTKCKCMVTGPEQPCERCRRLNKKCTPSVTVRRRNPRKSNLSRTAQLEQKVNGLVSLLEASAANSRRGEADASEIYTTSTSSQLSNSATSPDCGSQGAVTSRTSITGTASSSAVAAAPIDWEPTAAEAERLLETFRISKLPRFPFTYIPRDMSAAQLQVEQPFLWRVILYGTLRKHVHSVETGSRIRQIISQKMIMESEKNLDLLQGLLAYIAWPNLNTKDKPSMSVLTQLAMSVVYDLGLNRYMPSEGGTLVSCIKPGLLPVSLIRTMEERRAVLSCFVVTSAISSYLQTIDALRWTDHMEQCLQVLESRMESESDLLLVHQVRLQRVVEKINQDHWLHPNPDKLDHDPIISLYIKALAAEYEAVKGKIPKEISQDRTLILHSHHIDIRIHQLALIKSEESDFGRIQNLMTCLRAVKSFLDVAFAAEVEETMMFPFPIFAQIGHCLVILFKLTVFDDPLWDREYVRQTLDILAATDHLVETMQKAADLIRREDDQADTNFFTKGSHSMAQTRAMWQSKLEAVPLFAPAADIGAGMIPDLFSDLLTDQWLADLPAVWDK